MIRFLPPIRHGLMAPPRTDFSGSGITSSADGAQLAAEAAAVRAGPLGVVEGEVARRQLLEDVAADVAGKVLAEAKLRPRLVGALLRQDEGPVAALAERELEGVGDPARWFPAPATRRSTTTSTATSAVPVGTRLGSSSSRTRPAEADPLEAALAKPRKLVAEHARLGPQDRG